MSSSPSCRGAERAAKLLFLIGEDRAVPVIAALGEDCVEPLARSLAELGGVGLEESVAILADFVRSVPALAMVGGYRGACMAARLMAAAFGPEKAESIMMNAMFREGIRPSRT
jgi:flagellar motor switch protein FliG